MGALLGAGRLFRVLPQRAWDTQEDAEEKHGRPQAKERAPLEREVSIHHCSTAVQ